MMICPYHVRYAIFFSVDISDTEELSSYPFDIMIDIPTSFMNMLSRESFDMSCYLESWCEISLSLASVRCRTQLSKGRSLFATVVLYSFGPSVYFTFATWSGILKSQSILVTCSYAVAFFPFICTSSYQRYCLSFDLLLRPFFLLAYFLSFWPSVYRSLLSLFPFAVLSLLSFWFPLTLRWRAHNSSDMRSCKDASDDTSFW